MFAPDDGVARLEELSPKAIKLWLFFCTWRDHTTGYSRKGFDRAVEELKLPRATAYRVHRELLDGDWISETPDGRVGLRGGDFSPYDKTEEARLVWATPRESLPGERSLSFETDGGKSLNSETEILKSETVCLKNETGAYKDRARGFPSNSPSDHPSHTPPTPSRAGEAPPAGGGVCVSLQKSRFPFEDVRAWAESRKAEGAGIDPYAVAMARWRDGLADDGDEGVSAFLARREQVREGRAPAGPRRMPFHVAAQKVSSVKLGGADWLAFIENELPDVSDEDKAKLRQTFMSAPSEVERRAHAPP